MPAPINRNPIHSRDQALKRTLLGQRQRCQGFAAESAGFERQATSGVWQTET